MMIEYDFELCLYFYLYFLEKSLAMKSFLKKLPSFIDHLSQLCLLSLQCQGNIHHVGGPKAFPGENILFGCWPP